VDVLSRNTTWTFERDATSGARFVGISYYDGQGVMIRKGAGVRSALELGGMSVCVQKDTTSRDNVERYFAINRMPLQLVEVSSPEAMLADYREGNCDLVTSDQAQLYALRSRMEQQGDHQILPEVISREPLGPAVRAGDDQWATIVRWVLYALIETEQRDLNSDNVDRVRENSTYPVVRWMLGSECNVGEGLGLDADWVYRVIRSVGNYGEMFERNLGSDSALKIKRGLNAPWMEGGLLYSPPFK
jgi:general L-amino acid transport system substrate-binding protein